MVLGDDCSAYLERPLGGPFLNYRLTKTFLSGEKSLEQKSQLFRKLSEQKADFILDQEGSFQNLLKELPALQQHYKQSSPGIFVKIEN